MKRYLKLEIEVFVILTVIAISTVAFAERRPLNFKRLFSIVQKCVPGVKID